MCAGDVTVKDLFNYLLLHFSLFSLLSPHSSLPFSLSSLPRSHSYSQSRELVDFATVSDQEIKNDDVIYMVFQKEGPGGGWEGVQVDTLAQFGEEAGATGTVP